MRGGSRPGAGRKPGKRDPRLSPSEAAALLASLVPGAVTPSDYARALGCRPERVREALRDGCTVRRADGWRSVAGRSSPVAPDRPSFSVGRQCRR